MQMLYASTRNSLTKSLGSTHFTDTLFATSKTDITPAAYASHKAHIAAPKLVVMTDREREMEAVRDAERQAGGGNYEGSRARRSHVGRIAMNWSEEAETAVRDMGQTEGDYLVVMVRFRNACMFFPLDMASIGIRCGLRDTNFDVSE